jgi:putative membrane protein
MTQPHHNDPSREPMSARYPLILLAVFAVWWTLLAIAPHYRHDWMLENLLVVIGIALLAWHYRRLRFSNLAYTALFVFFCLHEIGAHYTYSEVPWNEWSKSLFNWDAMAAFGAQRNHFDRLVHFSYGLLIVPAVIELIEARGPLRGMWRNVVPVMFIMSNSEVYEIIEWQAAEHFGGELGQAYLGSQGDIWDAQKDSLMAAIGALLGVVIYRIIERRESRKSA